jgi:hypothetical protein
MALSALTRQNFGSFGVIFFKKSAKSSRDEKFKAFSGTQEIRAHKAPLALAPLSDWMDAANDHKLAQDQDICAGSRRKS